MWAHADLPPELLRGGAAAMPGLAAAIEALKREGLFDAFNVSDQGSDSDSDDGSEDMGPTTEAMAIGIGGDSDDSASDSDSDDMGPTTEAMAIGIGGDGDDSDDGSDDSDSDDSDSEDDASDDDGECQPQASGGNDEPEEVVEIATVRASPALLPIIQQLAQKSKEALALEEASDSDDSLRSEDYVKTAASGPVDEQSSTEALSRVNVDGDLMALDARALFRLLSQRQPVVPMTAPSF